MSLINQFAKAEMLIRKPVSEVFEAFINPEITTKFWFTQSTGRLQVAQPVEWTWEMYNMTIPITVKAIEPFKRILIEWGNPSDLTSVEWRFSELSTDATLVSIVNTIIGDDIEKAMAMVRDSTEGFTLVLAGLKALLEYNITLNLVGDRFPKGLNP
ncbi:SRPBCC family protein [Dyadobacter sp. CY312]|uniref:SRPBCC family protein n=1 Tax=Dyadobacter sp. CY312 TaxID=2907303 RepID=UPI001F2DDC63|nr:SRPBCC family protein [Dyadobacter sp. CY312]MCE7039121.1 SRPBCC family protein [Dyadobacter sp. CY312]